MRTEFVLGASDPEMEAIEWLLKGRGLQYQYATIDGRRVRPFEAYRASEPDGFFDGRVIFVESRAPIQGKEVIVVDHHRPGDPGFGLPPEKAWEASSLGQVCKLLGLGPETRVQVQDAFWPAHLVAAADHCLTAAYQGQVPGVSPFDMILYRDHVRAQFLGVGPGEYGEMVERAKVAILQAPEIRSGVRDLRPLYRREGPVQEAQEAAARVGTAILYELPKGDRLQVGLIGASPEQVEWFMQEFASAEGLRDIYGDPARGFAGGFLERRYDG